MLYKKRTMPNILRGLIALEKRLAPGHEVTKYIAEKRYNQQAGYAGELQYDKCLTEFMPSYPHAILHDICLKQDGIYFQMDSILITPSVIIISEVKNIAGTIIVKSKPTQFIRVHPPGERKTLRNPASELNRKEHFLRHWLNKNDITIPVKGLIVFAYNNELVIEEEPETEIVFTYDVPSYFRTLSMQTENLSKTEIKNLAFQLIKNHQSYNPFPMVTSHNIDPIKINPGVICIKCDRLGMKWLGRKWECPHCKHTGIAEHINAIEDWFMLLDNKITNSQFRYFTGVPSRNIARRLLAKSSLSLKGTRKAAYYINKIVSLQKNDTS